MLPVNIFTVDSHNPLRLVNSSKAARPVDVRKPIPSLSSNKNVRTVNSNEL